VKAAATDRHALIPLPTTRALGEKFGLSHGTAFRVLCRLEERKQVWREANGRFYPALARRVLGRPKPLAVVFRRMAAWSSLCREVMEGFTDECGQQERGVLLLFNKDLIVQPSPQSPPRVAPPRRQRELLQEMLLLHGESLGGMLFDELWSEDALEKTLPAGANSVTFYRSGRPGGIGSIGADFRTGALMALSHLLACGYEHIVLLNPFPHYEPSRLFLAAAQAVYREIAGTNLPEERIIPLFEPARRGAFLRKLASRKSRCGLICPEDNSSIFLAAELQARGIPLGTGHGLISVMGTSEALSAQVSAVRYDFRTMGKLAARALCEGRSEGTLLAPTLVPGRTTGPAS